MKKSRFAEIKFSIGWLKKEGFENGFYGHIGFDDVCELVSELEKLYKEVERLSTIIKHDTDGCGNCFYKVESPNIERDNEKLKKENEILREAVETIQHHGYLSNVYRLCEEALKKVGEL